MAKSNKSNKTNKSNKITSRMRHAEALYKAASSLFTDEQIARVDTSDLNSDVAQSNASSDGLRTHIGQLLWAECRRLLLGYVAFYRANKLIGKSGTIETYCAGRVLHTLQGRPTEEYPTGAPTALTPNIFSRIVHAMTSSVFSAEPTDGKTAGSLRPILQGNAKIDENGQVVAYKRGGKSAPSTDKNACLNAGTSWYKRAIGLGATREEILARVAELFNTGAQQAEKPRKSRPVPESGKPNKTRTAKAPELTAAHLTTPQGKAELGKRATRNAKEKAKSDKAQRDESAKRAKATAEAGAANLKQVATDHAIRTGVASAKSALASALAYLNI